MKLDLKKVWGITDILPHCECNQPIANAICPVREPWKIWKPNCKYEGQLNYQSTLTLPVLRDSCFGQYLDLSKDNNARFQMSMVYDFSKRKFMHENKDKMDEGGLIVVDGSSGDGVVGGGSGSASGATVGDNDAPLVVFEITNHYDYNHTSFIDFAPPRECFACICQICKADVTVESTTEEHTTIDNPSTTSKDKEKDKMGNPFYVEYVEGISQQSSDSLNYGIFVDAYAEYLSNGLQVPNDGLENIDK
ncbi:hypothetical protein FXO38_03453 [Capsicum annuum]|nr:hypothetical protein FXO37_27023 [Capsicum annuum]KAF3678040.1 hypothetical protein FXO38_03453 [Capsicum annuum]